MKTIHDRFCSWPRPRAACFAQQWEFGGVGGGSFLGNVRSRARPARLLRVSSPARPSGRSSARTCIAHLSGEIRYEYLQSNLRLQSGGNRSHLFRRGARRALRPAVPHQSQGLPHSVFRRGGRRHEDLPGNRHGGSLSAAQPVWLFHQDPGIETDGHCGRRHQVCTDPEGHPADGVPRFHYDVPQGTDHSGARREVRRAAARFRSHGGNRLRILKQGGIFSPLYPAAALRRHGRLFCWECRPRRQKAGASCAVAVLTRTRTARGAVHLWARALVLADCDRAPFRGPNPTASGFTGGRFLRRRRAISPPAPAV